jgi:hypothetical protein
MLPLHFTTKHHHVKNLIPKAAQLACVVTFENWQGSLLMQRQPRSLISEIGKTITSMPGSSRCPLGHVINCSSKGNGLCKQHSWIPANTYIAQPIHAGGTATIIAAKQHLIARFYGSPGTHNN